MTLKLSECVREKEQNNEMFLYIYIYIYIFFFFSHRMCEQSRFTALESKKLSQLVSPLRDLHFLFEVTHLKEKMMS